MAAKENWITLAFRFFHVYNDGKVELFNPPNTIQKVTPFDDSTTGVRSKDAVDFGAPVLRRVEEGR